MNILIAPNAFKNSLPATRAASAISEGLEQSSLHCSCHCFPVGDGGDGTGTILVQRLQGKLEEVEVKDPLGRIITAHYGLIDQGHTAVIEMANASGLRLLKREERSPLHANSFGTGQLLLHALDKGARKIILCIGGSATVDGATGILRALGLGFYNDRGNLLSDLPYELSQLASVDVSELDPRMKSTELIILCDVDNPLLGEQGAASVFGPQKGASTEDVQHLEAGLSQLAKIIEKQTGKKIGSMPHGGAAGGTAAGLHAFLDAKLVSGIDFFLQLTGFEKALASADLLITGEGSLDAQTVQGKGPMGIARMARQKNIPVIALAGQVPEISTVLKNFFDVVLCIAPGPVDKEEALKTTEEDLRRTAHQVGNLLSLSFER